VGEEFEGDLAGAVFWGADLSDAVFRDVDLSRARISHARLVDVEVDALVERVVINGVDVTDHVNERDPWYPLRAMLRPTDPDGMRAAWVAIEAAWATTCEQARALPDAALHESVAGEWSFVDTIRHLVFGIDKWCTVPILGGTFDPIGLPNTGSAAFPWPGLDRDARPSMDEATAAHAARAALVRHHLEALTPAELARSIDVLENGATSVQEGIHTVFEEAFWHIRYARRDLEHLARTGPSSADAARVTDRGRRPDPSARSRSR